MACSNLKLGELFEELAAIIAKLRDPNGGCPWDLEQTHQSLKPYLIEESYEVLDAIDNAPDKLSEELGDVLLQVMLHSQIGADEKRFCVADVLEILSKKLIKRHPHVFGKTQVKDTSQVLENWEKIKRKELKQDESMLGGIPSGLPALLKAQRIGAKVARVGFDWPDAEGVREKIKEELVEFLEASKKENDKDKISEEFGDLLFTIAQLGRVLGLDSETILNQANAKFCTRFKAMEKIAGPGLKDLGREKLEGLWVRVKALET